MSDVRKKYNSLKHKEIFIQSQEMCKQSQKSKSLIKLLKWKLKHTHVIIVCGVLHKYLFIQ